VISFDGVVTGRPSLKGCLSIAAGKSGVFLLSGENAMKSRHALAVASGCATLAAAGAAAAAEGQGMAMPPSFNSFVGFGLLELPFLFVAIVYSLRTASALRGGVFGRGMMLMAGGLVVMACGHVLMMLDMVFHTNVLAAVFGVALGGVLWVVALLASWALMGSGFHSIYRASRA
jgi:hypothetical protein